jgi:hypothetical protein
VPPFDFTTVLAAGSSRKLPICPWPSSLLIPEMLVRAFN